MPLLAFDKLVLDLFWRKQLLQEFLSNSKSMNNLCFTITVKFRIIFLLSFLSCWTGLKPCSMNSTANIDQMYVILQSTAFRLDYFLPTKNPLNVWLSTDCVDKKWLIHVSFILWFPNSKEVLLFFFFWHPILGITREHTMKHCGAGR